MYLLHKCTDSSTDILVKRTEVSQYTCIRTLLTTALSYDGISRLVGTAKA